MAMPTLRYGDGFADIAPDLRDFVKILQLGLKNLGYLINTDGLFSRETEKVVIAFQQTKGLPDDGKPTVIPLLKMLRFASRKSIFPLIPAVSRNIRL